MSRRPKSISTAPASARRHRRMAFASLAAAALVAVAMGVPTDLIDTPWFTRDVPPTWWSYPVWVVTSLLSGVLIASYLPSTRPPDRATGSRVGGLGGIVGFLAIGCPVCNKIVLILLGTAGALTYFEPIQPLLAAVSVILLVAALWWRFRRQTPCGEDECRRQETPRHREPIPADAGPPGTHP